MITNIDYFKKYNKIPFDYKNPNANALYIIAFFERRRALLIRKDLSVICTFETRKAKQLLNQAQDNKWVGHSFDNSNIGERPEMYPRTADVLYYIEVNRP